MSRERALLWTAAGVALAVRIVAALTHPAWHDEYFTVWAVRGDWATLLAALRSDSGPPLLYALAKLLAGAGVAPLAAARSVSVAAGALAVVFAGLAAGQRDRRAAWMAALLLALHPLAVAWSAEGRAYGLLALAVCVAWWSYERLAGDRGGGVAGLAIAVALGCWSHGLGLVLAAAAAAAPFAVPRRHRRRALSGVAVGLASFLPWAPVMAGQPTAAVAWMVDAWRAMPATARLLAPVRLVPPAAPFNTALDLPGAPLAVVVACAAACIVLAVASRPSRSHLVLVAGPLVALWCAAGLGLPVLTPGRAEALYLAPFLGALALGGARLRIGPGLVLALAVAGAASDTVAIRDWHVQPRTREAVVAQEIRTALPAGAVVVTSGYVWLDVWYRLARADVRYEVMGIPVAATSHPGWWVEGLDPIRPEEVERAIQRLLPRSSTCAVVVPDGSVVAPTLRDLARRLGLRPAGRGMAIELWLPPGPGP